MKSRYSATVTGTQGRRPLAVNTSMWPSYSGRPWISPPGLGSRQAFSCSSASSGAAVGKKASGRFSWMTSVARGSSRSAPASTPQRPCHIDSR